MQQQIHELSPLFEAVQMSAVFEDGKTFVDCIPKEPTEAILQRYLQLKDKDGFDLKEFVRSCFELPKVFAAGFKTDADKTAAEHIHQLWAVLTRQPDEKKGSLIPLPHSYIVPGGRFGEVYYWDSYFTMLGLKEAGLFVMIENMVNNFTHLIQTLGFIPNGNRTYYNSRSQPPFYALMVNLLAEIKGQNILPHYLSALETEYLFWMKGTHELNEETNASYHVVKMKDGEILNRYWDEQNTARPESYREDTELTQTSSQPAQQLYRNLRAGAASGWDYSSRWFKDDKTLGTIHCTGIIPVDLNSLLFTLEQTLAAAYHINGNEEKALHYSLLAQKRKEAIIKYCWNETAQFFGDYDWEENKQKQTLTLAGVVPLFCKLASQEQADKTAAVLTNKFLNPGGLVTTLEVTGQQWDAPNGWAPLQWMSIMGLNYYKQTKLAKEIAERWLALNDKVFAATGKMMEKYNVEDLSKEAGGGEYPSQDGFGWSNGVYLAMMKIYGNR
jgi:alpha,alpha-trehalase